MPGYGVNQAYTNWSKVDPWLTVRVLLHGLHPNSGLSHPALTKRIFFAEDIPDAYVKEFQQRMAPYESYRWCLDMMKQFADPKKTMASITGSATGLKMLIMTGAKDVTTTPDMAVKLASFYRKSQEEVGSGDAPREPVAEPEEDLTKAGVRCAFPERCAHHLQNDVAWKDGAKLLLKFYEDLQG